MTLAFEIIVVVLAWSLYILFKIRNGSWKPFTVGPQEERCWMCSEYVLQRQVVATSEVPEGAVPRAGFVRILKEPITFRRGVATELHQHSYFIPAPSVYGPPASCLLNTVPVSCWRCDGENPQYFDHSFQQDEKCDLMREFPPELIGGNCTVSVGYFEEVQRAGNNFAHCDQPEDRSNSTANGEGQSAGISPAFRRVFEKYENPESANVETFSDSESYHYERSFSQLCWDACPKSPFGLPEDVSIRLTRPRGIPKPSEPVEPIVKPTRRFGRFRRCRSCAVSPVLMCGEGKAGIQAQPNGATFNANGEKSAKADIYKLRWGVPDPTKQEEEWFDKHQT
ncbi:hypothetical protein TTRE_0000161601 [Trichuris trichiura]|uniref:Uncharacterized protein n=1 Tax=Trichuris trichiura TaxID=36087 RepID=A0A077YZ51_TRITR|nr:hypothetical protein TTRE_0000161601 [Trichuris trichiura]